MPPYTSRPLAWSSTASTISPGSLASSRRMPRPCSAQLPGITLIRPRNTATYHSSPWGTPRPVTRPSTLTMVQARIGTSTAHRNGLLRTKAEQNISQPTVGSDHSSCSGRDASRRPVTAKGWAWVMMASGCGMPPAAMATIATSHSTRPTSRPIASASSGASSRAQAALESTVCASDTGMDFQNSALRSRRSSYRLPRA